jgi:adenylate kinase family enzyme
MGGKLDQMARTSIGRAAYDARIRASGTPEQAIADAVYAYDNYLPNFSNLSSLVSGADKLLMYVGPSQAGTRTLFRTIKRDPWGTSGKLGAAGLAMTGFAGYNLSQDQGKAFYDDMREAGKQYILDNNTVIVLPGAKKNNQTGEWTGIIKIPLPPELRPVNRAVHEAMYDGQPGVPTKQLALAAFDFVTGQSRTLSNPAIQVGSSLVGGKDIRTGRDIIDPSMTEEEKRAARIKYLQYSTGVVGQSTVSDGDGLGKFVKSITDRAYGAKGLSTGGRYYKDEGESIKEIGLNENERKAYQSVVAPRSKDLAGNTIKEKTYYDQSAKAETWLKYPKTFDVSKRMDQKRRERGEPGDPLFELDEQQRKVVLNLMSNASPGNKEDKALTKLNPWLKDFYKQRGDYFDAVKSTLTPEKQKEMGIDPKGITIPQATPELQAKMDSSAKMDSKTKRQFYVDNPDVSDFLAQQGAYQRIKRDYMGLPQFDEYPKPDDATQKVMDEYNKLPKGNGPPKRDGTPSSPNRSAWIKSHPNEWAAMSGAFDKIAAWTAAEEGSLAVYEGLNAEGELDGTPLTDNGGGGGGSFGFGGKTYQYDANGNIVEDATRKRSYFSAMEPGKLDLSYPEPKNTKLSVTPFKIKAPARPSNNKRLRLKI